MPAPVDNRAQQVGFACALLVLEGVVFGYLSQTRAFPAFVCGIALLGVATAFRVTLARERRALAAMLVGVLFILSWGIAPYQPLDPRTFLQYPLAYSIGQYFLALQALQFIIREPNERITAAFPLFGTLVLICAADIYVTYLQFAVYQSAVILFVLLTAGFYGAGRTFVQTGLRPDRLRPLLAGLGLLLASLAAFAGCTLLSRHWDDLERWFDPRRLEPQVAGMGFGRQAHLGSVEFRKNQQAAAVALRVYADEAPGYLRGAAFDTYSQGHWDFTAAYRQVNPLRLEGRAVPAELRQVPVFPMREADSEIWSRVQVWKDPQVAADALFVPAGTCVIDTQAESLSMDDYDIALSTTLRGPESVAWVPATQPTARLSRIARHQLTSVSGDLLNDPQLQAVVKEVFAGSRTSLDKVAAVENWFHRNYQYSLSVRVPSRVEPIRWFLLERPAAHCEFFASGAATLLRMEGVPCRYVTGFVAGEYNSAGGYWIARNRDAHAWVEAYTPERGWVVVEATPGAGVPARSTSSLLGSLLDDMLLRIQMVRARFGRGGWRGLLWGMWTLFTTLFHTIPGLIVSALLFCWAATIVVRALRWRTAERRRVVPTAAQRLLAEVDQRMRRHDFVRLRGETLHQFATRIGATATERPQLLPFAEWYRRYAELRYSGHEELELALPPLPSAAVPLKQ